MHGKHTISAATHLRDLEGTLAGSEGGTVLALVELAQIDLEVRHRRPQAQRVGVESVVAVSICKVARWVGEGDGVRSDPPHER